jgi:phosphopantothenoylcysteine decarboxylase / phosphopantothenate---cysteine ligase
MNHQALAGKHLILGVTGGIAAYKSAELVRLLQKQGASVQVVMTEAATHFVGAVTFQALSGRQVFTDQWDARIDNNMAHIDLVREADAMLIAPASADCLAKIAHGLADDLLTTMVLARDCPLLVAPAMNRQMWENPATQRNVAQLAVDGITLLGPAEGEQACGETGAGRMLEPSALVESLIAFFTPKLLAGKKWVMTAGPTFEAIDTVRGITNLSSGKMGYAIARAAQHAGAEVVLVSGPVALPVPVGVRCIQVQSAKQMHQAVMGEVGNAAIFMGVAAVADYGIANASSQKLKKDGSSLPPSIELVLNPDILAEVASLPSAPVCVGFAAESENLYEYAEAKRLRKNIPLIVGNQIQDGFGGDSNTIVLFDKEGAHPLPYASKDYLAATLVKHVASML